MEPSLVPPHIDDGGAALTLSLAQVDELNRLQRRILYRSVLLNYILEEEKLERDKDAEGCEFTMGEALAELLDDIGDAARGIGKIMRTEKGGA